MIDLYKQKGDWKIAEKFVELNLKKSNKGKKSWSLFVAFLYEWLLITADEQKEQEIESKITKTLSRAKQSLNKMDYTYLLTQKAINEFKNGELERGQTSFNSLVSSNPNRTDIWIVYLDMMIKYCAEHAKTRQLFNKVVSQKIKPKSMKTVYVKYLNFEKEHGDEQKVSNVKRLAQKFIEEQIQKKGQDESEEEGQPPKYINKGQKMNGEYKNAKKNHNDDANEMQEEDSDQVQDQFDSDEEDGVGV